MTTCTVTCTIYDQSGEPEVGAVVRAVLLGRVGGDAPGQYAKAAGSTNSSGQCDVVLLRNSAYEVTILGERGRQFRTTATVPDQATAALHTIVEFPV